ncbi:MAG TPA: glycine cleavage T C-terminal barrel domain-containing protein, partial [Verrucomicrobiae bacterium]|nr:glycine cleavage T C-terminal barrel domain-containing protein [Verrucomicrobiae bacterium]
HEFHSALGARFIELNGCEIVIDYGDTLAEYRALRETAGVLDFSFRSRICLTGNDRVRFLHGQVTNDVKKLRAGEGCYAAVTTAKGKMESDLNLFSLPDELLLDFEPGLSEKISQRLERFIVSDDVQIVDAAPHYGLLTVQGPKAAEVVKRVGLLETAPAKEFGIVKIADETLGEIYVATFRRLLAPGFDIFVPNQSMGAVADKLAAAAKSTGGRLCGWTAFETTRIEAGAPRFGADMDETNLPMESIESRAVSFNKGCYIGQEVLNRIHAIGHVAKELRGLRLAEGLKSLPDKGAKLLRDGKEAGYVTSAVRSPALDANIALGYVRREANEIGTELTLQTADGTSPAKIVNLPFGPP